MPKAIAVKNICIVLKNAETCTIVRTWRNVVSENNVDHIAPVSWRQIQALAKRARRVGHHLFRNFSHQLRDLVFRLIKCCVDRILILSDPHKNMLHAVRSGERGEG